MEEASEANSEVVSPGLPAWRLARDLEPLLADEKLRLFYYWAPFRRAIQK